jgi:hypothetical protein
MRGEWVWVSVYDEGYGGVWRRRGRRRGRRRRGKVERNKKMRGRGDQVEIREQKGKIGK